MFLKNKELFAIQEKLIKPSLSGAYKDGMKPAFL